MSNASVFVNLLLSSFPTTESIFYEININAELNNIVQTKYIKYIL